MLSFLDGKWRIAAVRVSKTLFSESVSTFDADRVEFFQNILNLEVLPRFAGNVHLRASLMHHQQAVAVFDGIAQVMRDHDRCQLLFADDPARQFHDDFGRLGIKRRRVFIQNQELDGGHGAHQQRHGLTLAAGEIADRNAHLILQTEAELGEHGAVFLRLFAVDAGHEVERLALVVRHGHILQNGHRGARAARGILIDAADAAMALMLRHVGDILVADEDFALVDRDGAADDVEQRRFARTVGADDADELPFRNGEGEIVEQAGLVDRAALVYLDDIAQLKHDVSPSFDDRPRR